MFRARIPLEGIGGTYCSIDSPDEHLSNENVSRLLIIEFSKPASARKVGSILYRPELEKEEYVRIGVWRQHLEIIDPMKWKEELPFLNMKEKTILLIWNKQDNVRHNIQRCNKLYHALYHTSSFLQATNPPRRHCTHPPKAIPDTPGYPSISRCQQNAAKAIHASRSTQRFQVLATTPVILHYELTSSFFLPLIQIGTSTKQRTNKNRTSLSIPSKTIHVRR